MRKLFVAMAALVPLAGLAGAATPAQATTFYDVSSAGESYGSETWQVATVSKPVGAVGARPTMFFVHGGGWSGGGRAAWEDQAFEYAHRGWVSVNINYKLAVKDGTPNDGLQQMADIVAAVNYFKAKSYTSDSQLVIQGDSAGGHLATLEGAKMRGVFKGVIAWSPVVVPWNAHFDSVSLGERADEFYNGISQGENQTVSALRYVDAYPETPPMYLIYARDEWVKKETQSQLLCAHLGPAKCSSSMVNDALHGTEIRDAFPDLETEAYQYAKQVANYAG